MGVHHVTRCRVTVMTEVIVEYVFPLLRVLFHHIVWRHEVLTRTSVPTPSPRCLRTLQV